ncbi:MAG: hypothetical protein Q9210_000593, partial [Variospora velana]
MLSPEINSTTVGTNDSFVTVLLLIAIGYLIIMTLYRLYFHPLARYPGPKLAALTGWYETYFDCVRGGQFSQHIDKLHLEYGNIIRINPRELHIRDPGFFDRFYTSSSKLDKDPWYYNFAGIPRSTFATSSAALHRQRRSAIAKAFASSSETSERIETYTYRLIDSLQRHHGIAPGKPVRMSDVFWMHASDVVTGCMMPRGSNYVDNPGSAPQYGPLYKTLANFVLWNRHFGHVFRILSCMPRFIVEKVAAAPFAEALVMQDGFVSQIIEASKKPLTHPPPGTQHANLPNHLHLSVLPLSDKTTARLLEEISMIIGAGTEAVGAALSITAYHLLCAPSALSKLQSELSAAAAALPTAAGKKMLPYSMLRENCPYLTACIKEGLRLSQESNRLPRINRHSATIYGGYVIPKDTIISMSLRDVHLDPSIFPSPHAFIPERWLAGGGPHHRLEDYFVPFGRGSRACVGRALAMEEL